ncbi:T9SS type A sorting domain-containing protein [Acidiluteibacter ferrifornacis]|uniref:T9SS type A sorting domain-containing protein n=1 Tax=Acidiluteibacter ferrifornacis TaxID=2692424 RepID=A0A6N9NNP3_9FLAO|nr:T9SS type A sorting domain-containing protein [Acidiluteibacter ferrifornacis]NBG67021.1 T9SS type A sorting domain-containing protein [Acidiluteibacter ferrifornacis]
MYPNPTRDEFTVEIANQLITNNKVEPQVYNFLGEEIPLSIDFKAANKFYIDLQDQSEGIYFITFKYNDKVVTKKVSLIK